VGEPDRHGFYNSRHRTSGLPAADLNSSPDSDAELLSGVKGVSSFCTAFDHGADFGGIVPQTVRGNFNCTKLSGLLPPLQASRMNSENFGGLFSGQRFELCSVGLFDCGKNPLLLRVCRSSQRARFLRLSPASVPPSVRGCTVRKNTFRFRWGIKKPVGTDIRLGCPNYFLSSLFRRYSAAHGTSFSSANSSHARFFDGIRSIIIFKRFSSSDFRSERKYPPWASR